MSDILPMNIAPTYILTLDLRAAMNNDGPILQACPYNKNFVRIRNNPATLANDYAGYARAKTPIIAVSRTETFTDVDTIHLQPPLCKPIIASAVFLETRFSQDRMSQDRRLIMTDLPDTSTTDFIQHEFLLRDRIRDTGVYLACLMPFLMGQIIVSARDMQQVFPQFQGPSAIPPELRGP
jgi:hypothetical protein